MTYVNNYHNRRLGRVGKPLGTHVEHVDGTITIYDPSKDKIPTRIHADSPENQRLGRVGKPVTTPFPCRFYVDNPSNHRLGRAGQPYVGLDEVYHRLQTATDYQYDTLKTEEKQVLPQPNFLRWPTTMQHLSTMDYQYDALKTEVKQVLPQPNFLRLQTTRQRLSSDSEISKAEEKQALPQPLRLQKTTDKDPSEEEKQENIAISQVQVPQSNRKLQMPQSSPRLQMQVLSDRPQPAQDAPTTQAQDAPTTRGTAKSICSEDQGKELYEPSADNKIHLWAVPLGDTHSPSGGIRLSDEIHIPGEKWRIYAGLWIPYGLPITFKKFSISPTLTRSEKWRTKVKQEMKFLYSLAHPSIVTIYGAVLDIGNIGVILERLPRSLYQAIFVDKQNFSECQKISLMKQISEGVEFLHRLGVALCTLSSESVHLSDHNCAKIESFGPRTLCCENRYLHDHIDERYAAPEILEDRLFTAKQLQKADIHSLALVLYELFESKLACKINVVKTQNKRAAQNVPSTVYSLLLDCLSDSPENRPDAGTFSKLTLV